jgi:hypothetical protein
MAVEVVAMDLGRTRRRLVGALRCVARTRCAHEAVVRTQRAACGELEALGVPWRAGAPCPGCGALVELVWDADRCAVWERRPAGIAFLREEAAPPGEPPPTDQ